MRLLTVGTTLINLERITHVEVNVTIMSFSIEHRRFMDMNGIRIHLAAPGTVSDEGTVNHIVLEFAGETGERLINFLVGESQLL
jgi:hypothetical protein